MGANQASGSWVASRGGAASVAWFPVLAASKMSSTRTVHVLHGPGGGSANAENARYVVQCTRATVNMARM